MQSVLFGGTFLISFADQANGVLHHNLLLSCAFERQEPVLCLALRHAASWDDPSDAIPSLADAVSHNLVDNWANLLVTPIGVSNFDQLFLRMCAIMMFETNTSSHSLLV